MGSNNMGVIDSGSKQLGVALGLLGAQKSGDSHLAQLRKLEFDNLLKQMKLDANAKELREQQTKYTQAASTLRSAENTIRSLSGKLQDTKITHQGEIYDMEVENLKRNQKTALDIKDEEIARVKQNQKIGEHNWKVGLHKARDEEIKRLRHKLTWSGSLPLGEQALLDALLRKQHDLTVPDSIQQEILEYYGNNERVRELLGDAQELNSMSMSAAIASRKASDVATEYQGQIDALPSPQSLMGQYQPSPFDAPGVDGGFNTPMQSTITKEYNDMLDKRKGLALKRDQANAASIIAAQKSRDFGASVGKVIDKAELHKTSSVPGADKILDHQIDIRTKEFDDNLDKNKTDRQLMHDKVSEDFANFSVLYDKINKMPEGPEKQALVKKMGTLLDNIIESAKGTGSRSASTKKSDLPGNDPVAGLDFLKQIDFDTWRKNVTDGKYETPEQMFQGHSILSGIDVEPLVQVKKFWKDVRIGDIKGKKDVEFRQAAFNGLKSMVAQMRQKDMTPAQVLAVMEDIEKATSGMTKLLPDGRVSGDAPNTQGAIFLRTMQRFMHETGGKQIWDDFKDELTTLAKSHDRKLGQARQEILNAKGDPQDPINKDVILRALWANDKKEDFENFKSKSLIRLDPRNDEYVELNKVSTYNPKTKRFEGISGKGVEDQTLIPKEHVSSLPKGFKVNVQLRDHPSQNPRQKLAEIISVDGDNVTLGIHYVQRGQGAARVQDTKIHQRVTVNLNDTPIHFLQGTPVKARNNAISGDREEFVRYNPETKKYETDSGIFLKNEGNVKIEGGISDVSKLPEGTTVLMGSENKRSNAPWASGYGNFKSYSVVRPHTQSKGGRGVILKDNTTGRNVFFNKGNFFFPKGTTAANINNMLKGAPVTPNVDPTTPNSEIPKKKLR